MAGSRPLNKYESPIAEQRVAEGEHRRVIGGRWEKIGRLQFDFLVEQGLRPDSHLLDVGCGALRGGVHFARYLEPGHYFGIDSNRSVLEAAIERELTEHGLQDRLPTENLRVTSRFDCDFGVPFDFALAQSVFTHLPLNHLQLCMFRLAGAMRPGGRFFVTFFEPEPGAPFDRKAKQVKVVTRPERDPFHYRPSDLRWAAQSVAGWDFRYIGDWGHPRGQRIAEFRLRRPLAERALDRARRALRRQPRSTA